MYKIKSLVRDLLFFVCSGQQQQEEGIMRNAELVGIEYGINGTVWEVWITDDGYKVVSEVRNDGK